MKYVALKPCNFGRSFYIGETIPGEKVDHGMAQALIKRGIIAELPEEKTEQPKPKKVTTK